MSMFNLILHLPKDVFILGTFPNLSACLEQTLLVTWRLGGIVEWVASLDLPSFASSPLGGKT